MLSPQNVKIAKKKNVFEGGKRWVTHLSQPLQSCTENLRADTTYETFLSSQRPVIVFLVHMIKQRFREV